MSAASVLLADEPRCADVARTAPPRIRLTDAQYTALVSAGVFEDVSFPDDPAAVLRPFIDGRHVTVTEASIAAVNAISNDCDDMAQDERDAERRGWLVRDSRVLSNLYAKMLRARP